MAEQPDRPTGQLSIDTPSADDVPAMAAFYRDLSPMVVRAYGPYGWEVTEQSLRDGPFARLAGGDEAALILRDDARAIWGHAFLSGVKSGAAHFGIGIHQSLLGGGLGRKLMTALLDQAGRELQLKEIRLTCVQDNDAAVGLYTSLGFEKTKEFIEENDGLPYFAMRKLVSDG